MSWNKRNNRNNMHGATIKKKYRVNYNSSEHPKSNSLNNFNYQNLLLK